MPNQSKVHPKTGSLLALDVGERRIGVAIADIVARLPRPLMTLTLSEHVTDDIAELAAQYQAVALVIGLPRGMAGQYTAQTASTEAFVRTLEKLGLPLHWQDESVTSKQAEAELRRRGKPYARGDIDALAATYILEDFLHDNPELAL